MPATIAARKNEKTFVGVLLDGDDVKRLSKIQKSMRDSSGDRRNATKSDAVRFALFEYIKSLKTCSQ